MRAGPGSRRVAGRIAGPSIHCLVLAGVHAVWGRTTRDLGGMMRPKSILLAALVGCAATEACTSAESASPDGTSAAGGMTAMVSDAHGWTEDERWSITPEPQLVIGILNGPEEYQFFDVSAAARQSDGDLVVVDAGAHTVRLYDRNGAFVALLGGAGSGPGEFQTPSQVMIGPDDVIRVWDNAEFRVTTFDAAGVLTGVQVVRLDGIARALTPPLYPATVQLLPGGDLLVRLVEKTKGQPDGRFRRQSGALRVSADLSVIDTLMFFADVEHVTVNSVFGPLPIVPPLAKRTQIAIHGKKDRVCVGEQEGPEITCFGPGSLRTLLRWSQESTAVLPREVAAWRDETIELYAQKMSFDDARRLVNQVPPLDVRPAYASLALDDAGHLWVERGPTEERGSTTVDYLVFDPVDGLLGVVPLPPLQVLEIGEDYLMGVYRDELEVEYLQVYGIIKPQQ